MYKQGTCALLPRVLPALLAGARQLLLLAEARRGWRARAEETPSYCRARCPRFRPVPASCCSRKPGMGGVCVKMWRFRGTSSVCVVSASARRSSASTDTHMSRAPYSGVALC